MPSAQTDVDSRASHLGYTTQVRRQDGRPLLMDPRTGAALPSGRLSAPALAAAAARSLYAGFSTNVSLKASAVRVDDS